MDAHARCTVADILEFESWPVEKQQLAFRYVAEHNPKTDPRVRVISDKELEHLRRWPKTIE